MKFWYRGTFQCVDYRSKVIFLIKAKEAKLFCTKQIRSERHEIWYRGILCVQIPNLKIILNPREGSRVILTKSNVVGETSNLVQR